MKRLERIALEIAAFRQAITPLDLCAETGESATACERAIRRNVERGYLTGSRHFARITENGRTALDFSPRHVTQPLASAGGLS